MMSRRNKSKTNSTVTPHKVTHSNRKKLLRQKIIPSKLKPDAEPTQECPLVEELKQQTKRRGQ
jgi:hypothetical protein